MRYDSDYSLFRDDESLSSHQARNTDDQNVPLDKPLSPTSTNKNKPIHKGPKTNPNHSLKTKQTHQTLPISQYFPNEHEMKEKEVPYLAQLNHNEDEIVNEENVQPTADFQKESLSNLNPKESQVGSNLQKNVKEGTINNKSKKNQPQKNKSQPRISKKDRDQIFIADHIKTLQVTLFEFFQSIEQHKCLVFDEKIRHILNKIHNPERKFTPNHQRDSQVIERQIKSEINAIDLFNGELYNQQMEYPNFHQDLQSDIQSMVMLFDQNSFIFCQEVTSELYQILRKICNIVLQFRHDLEGMKRQLREFGDKIASQQDPNHQYFYFGYQFTTIPERRRILKPKEMKTLQEAELKPQYRTPGTQFADFVEIAGFYLLEEMKKLKLYQLI